MLFLTACRHPSYSVISHVNSCNFRARHIIAILLLLMHSIILIGVVVGGEWIIESTWCTSCPTSWIADWLSSIAGRWQTNVHSDLVIPSLFSQRWLPIFERPSKDSCSSVLECTWATSACLHQYLSHQHPVLFALFCSHFSNINSVCCISSSSSR